MSDRFTKTGPKHLRTKLNSAGAGTFADDTDWAATNTEIPLDDRAPLPLRRHDGGGMVSRILVMFAAFDAAGARINRSTFTALLRPTGQFRRPDEGLIASGHELLQWDGADSAAPVPPNRWTTLEIVGGLEAFSIRLHTFVSIPAAATELRVYFQEA